MAAGSTTVEDESVLVVIVSEDGAMRCMNQSVDRVPEMAMQCEGRPDRADQRVAGLVHGHFATQQHHATSGCTTSDDYGGKRGDQLGRAFPETSYSDRPFRFDEKDVPSLRDVFCACPQYATIPILVTVRLGCATAK